MGLGKEIPATAVALWVLGSVLFPAIVVRLVLEVHPAPGGVACPLLLLMQHLFSPHGRVSVEHVCAYLCEYLKSALLFSPRRTCRVFLDTGV